MKSNGDLEKKDFSCWGNGDKYDDELIISHDPKIHGRTIADKILDNQRDANKWNEHLERMKNDKCPQCGSKDFEKNIDYIRDIEEEIQTFWCKKCHHDWTGMLV